MKNFPFQPTGPFFNHSLGLDLIRKPNNVCDRRSETENQRCRLNSSRGKYVERTPKFDSLVKSATSLNSDRLLDWFQTRPLVVLRPYRQWSIRKYFTRNAARMIKNFLKAFTYFPACTRRVGDVFSKNTKVELTRHSTYVWITLSQLPCWQSTQTPWIPKRERRVYSFIYSLATSSSFPENEQRRNLDTDRSTSSNQNSCPNFYEIGWDSRPPSPGGGGKMAARREERRRKTIEGRCEQAICNSFCLNVANEAAENWGKRRIGERETGRHKRE